jgi:hypothetical protein
VPTIITTISVILITAQYEVDAQSDYFFLILFILEVIAQRINIVAIYMMNITLSPIPKAKLKNATKT